MPDYDTGALYEGINRTMEKIDSDAKKAKSLRAALKAYDPNGGGKYDAMGLQDLEGVVQGTQMKSAQDMNTAKLADFAAQAEERKAIGAARTSRDARENDIAGSLSNFFRDYAGGPQPAPGAGDDMGTGGGSADAPAMAVPAAMSPQDRLIYALGRNPTAAAHPQFDNTINSILKVAGNDGPDPSPQAHDLPGGYLGFTLKGSKNLDVRPDLTKVQTLADGTQIIGTKTLPKVKPVDEAMTAKRAAETAKLNRATRSAITQELDANTSAANRLAAKPSRTPDEEQRLKSYQAAATRSQKELDEFDAGIHSKFQTTDAPTAAPAVEERVKVKAPDGKQYSLPKSQLSQAATQGFTLLP